MGSDFNKEGTLRCCRQYEAAKNVVAQVGISIGLTMASLFGVILVFSVLRAFGHYPRSKRKKENCFRKDETGDIFIKKFASPPKRTWDAQVG